MISVNDLKLNFDDRINYPRQGSYTIDQLNRWMYMASQSLYRQRLGLPEQAEFQTAVPKVSYARTRKIHSDLTPFRVFRDIPISGEILLDTDIPVDINYILNLRHVSYVLQEEEDRIKKLRKCDCKQFDTIKISNPSYKAYIGDILYVDENDWSNRVNSSYLKKAIFTPYSDQWVFNFPVQPNAIKIEYLKNPNKPVWNYTIVNDVEVFNPVGSVNLEWDEIMMYDLVSRMENLYSINVSDQMGIQFSESKIRNGE